MRIAVLAAVLIAPPFVQAQQPETLSLLKQPLYPPPLAADVRATLEADLAAARSALQKDPGNVDATLAAARADTGLGRVGDAIEALTRAIEVHQDDQRLHLERGRDLVVIRKFDAAERDIRKAGDLQASSCALGFVQYLKSEYKAARETYTRCTDPGIFAYLAGRFTGDSKQPRPEVPADTAQPPAAITLPGSVARKRSAPDQSVPAAYLDAAERLAAGKKDEARDLLKRIVEKHTTEWMTPAYIAAEADYSRVAKPTPRKKSKKK